MTRATSVAALAIAMLVPPSAAARTSFVPSDPLVKYQGYLQQVHAFDAFGDAMPALNPVRVAIVDSGLDTTHPEFPRSEIWAAKSFVSNALTDEDGHGTFVAGEIGAAVNNDKGIAGIAFPAKLIIAKIAGADASISVDDEAAAIRWSVDHGAQVINLSIGGVRDPLDPATDTFSQVEANAIEYAVRHNVVLVAAVGNADVAPTQPWRWASYPAALPHVLGVSALTQSGNVASFSDRDPIYNDLAAPGQNIFSTLPLALTSTRPSCPDQGYSGCGPEEFKSANGTSFAAPQVSAAAALLLALRPSLRADQVTNILERTATDVNPADGCRQCPAKRDLFSGWGRLDIERAISALGGPLPAPDRLEPNDDAGPTAPILPAARRQLRATLDYWDDQTDVYRIRLAAGQTIRVGVKGPVRTTVNLLLWKPGTRHVNDLHRQGLRAAESLRKGPLQRLVYRARRSGWYYVEVKLASRGFGAYTLSLSRQ